FTAGDRDREHICTAFARRRAASHSRGDAVLCRLQTAVLVHQKERHSGMAHDMARDAREKQLAQPAMPIAAGNEQAGAALYRFFEKHVTYDSRAGLDMPFRDRDTLQGEIFLELRAVDRLVLAPRHAKNFDALGTFEKRKRGRDRMGRRDAFVPCQRDFFAKRWLGRICRKENGATSLQKSRLERFGETWPVAFLQWPEHDQVRQARCQS